MNTRRSRVVLIYKGHYIAVTLPSWVRGERNLEFRRFVPQEVDVDAAYAISEICGDDFDYIYKGRTVSREELMKLFIQRHAELAKELGLVGEFE